MTDILPAKIISMLLDDVGARASAELAMASWAVNRAWQMSFTVYDGLEAQISLRPDRLIKDDGTEFGDTRDDEWIRMYFVLESDQFGDDGPAAARKSALQLRQLADEIDAKAAAGDYGREDAA